MQYITEADAQTYFNGKLNTEAWDDASSADRVKALTMATEAIDRLNFRGTKTDDAQALQFPRDDDTIVPTDIQYACAELALRLLDGVDPELEFENLRMVAQGYSNVRSTYDSGQTARHIIAGIPSITAWRYILPYLRDHVSVSLSRVS